MVAGSWALAAGLASGQAGQATRSGQTAQAWLAPGYGWLAGQSRDRRDCHPMGGIIVGRIRLYDPRQPEPEAKPGPELELKLLMQSTQWFCHRSGCRDH